MDATTDYEIEIILREAYKDQYESFGESLFEAGTNDSFALWHDILIDGREKHVEGKSHE